MHHSASLTALHRILKIPFAEFFSWVRKAVSPAVTELPMIKTFFMSQGYGFSWLDIDMCVRD